MNVLLHDIRIGWRKLWAQPMLTLVMLLIMALGIGANSAVFSLVEATLIKPLPFAQPDRLLHILSTTPEGKDFSTSEPDYLDFRDAADGLESLAATKDHNFILAGNGEPMRVQGQAVTANLFHTLGVQPRLGRDFDPANADADQDAVILSDHLWRQRFGSDPSVIGRSVSIDDRPQVVIGVMPPAFSFLGAELWRRLTPRANSDRGDHWLSMVGRLRDGVDVAQVRAQMDAAAQRIAAAHPAASGWSVRIESLDELLIGGEFRQALFLLSAAVGCLLLLACVNLAGLQLARYSRRRAELGMRSALGAARGRLVRQMLTETAILTVLGTLLGLGVALALLKMLPLLVPEALPSFHPLRLDGPVLGYSIISGVLVSLLCGLLPAWRASRANPEQALAGAGSTGVAGGKQRLHGGLVVVQLTLATVLLSGAAVMTQSFLRLRHVDPGYDAQAIWTASLQLGDANYPEPWQKVVFFNRLTDSLRGLPGVAAAGASIVEPFGGNNFVNDVTPLERAAEAGPAGLLQAGWRAATPGFFSALGLPLVQGRTFDERDSWDGPPRMVISQALAESLWPGQSAVGKQLYWGGTDGDPWTVIGVVGDYQDVSLDAGQQPLLFLPYNKLPWPSMTLLVRGHDAVNGMASAIRERIQAIDPKMPLPDVLPLEQQLSASLARPRFRALLMGAFALTALILAMAGVYALMAYSVSGRSREVGLRMALGASPARVMSLVMGSALRLLAIGLLLGLAGSWVLNRFMGSLLFDTSPSDPLALLLATALLAIVTLVAGYLPARRAARIAPNRALRYD